MKTRVVAWKVLPSVIVGLIVGALLGPFSLSCGVVKNNACAAEECPAGPIGPTGPQGPAGPQGAAGPSFSGCQWLYTQCNFAAGTECVQVCPANTHPIAGSCDAANMATLSENRASVANTAPFPPSPSPFTAYDRWVCETASGEIQFTYALCCPG
jgi:hypothetical protein